MANIQEFMQGNMLNTPAGTVQNGLGSMANMIRGTPEQQPQSTPYYSSFPAPSGNTSAPGAGLGSLAQTISGSGGYSGSRGGSMNLGSLSVNFNPSGGAMSFAKGGEIPSYKIGGKLGRAIEKPFRSSGVIGGALKPITEPLRNIIQDLGPVATIAAGIYSPWAAGLVGGLQGQRSFDFKRALMTGMTAYAAQGIAEGISDVGTAASAAPTVTDVAAELGANLGTEVATGAGSQAAMLADQAAAFGDYGLQNIASSAGYGVGPGSASFVGPMYEPSMIDKVAQSAGDTYNTAAKSVSDFGSGIKNIATGDVSMNQLSGAIKNAPSNVFELGPTGMAATGLMGYSGVAAIDEAEKAKLESDLANAKSQQEYDEIMAKIEASRQRGIAAMKANPYMFAKGGEIPRYGIGGIMRSLRTMLKPQVQAAEAPLPQQAEAVGIARSTAEKINPDQLRTYLSQMKSFNKEDQDAVKQMLANTYGLATGGSVDDAPGMDDISPVAMAQGGLGNLQNGLGYAKGGQPRFLSGGGDGMSDDIPATINGDQPARLADGEFVIPADVVSHLGNGSSKAGAKQLYSMMDKVRKARTGNKKQGKQINPAKFMPA